MAKIIKIYPYLHDLITEKQDCFGVVELRDELLRAGHFRDVDKKEVRSYIYYLLRKLESKKLIERVKGSSDAALFIKTKLFNSASFVMVDDVLPSSDLPNKTIDSEIPTELQSKHGAYKLELLTAMAEADEYRSLCDQYPELKSSLQDKYNQARDRSSSILGRIKALETILNTSSS